MAELKITYEVFSYPRLLPPFLTFPTQQRFPNVLGHRILLVLK